MEAGLRWPRRNMGLAGREWEKPKQPRIECRYVEGEQGFYMSSKGKTKENVHLLLNRHSPWSQRIWQGLRYLMSSFASARHIRPAFRNLKLPLPWGKCGAMKTSSVDDGVKEQLRCTHRYMGPNRMQQRVLRELANVLARPLSKLSLKCHSNCKRFLMTGRKQGELWSPSFKKAKKEDPGNHNQVSLTLIPPEHKKTLLHYHEGGLALQQLAQRHCRASIIGDTQLTGHNLL